MNRHATILSCPGACFQLGETRVLVEQGLQYWDMFSSCLQISHLLGKRERTVSHGVGEHCQTNQQSGREKGIEYARTLFHVFFRLELEVPCMELS
ncbi:MAG TPA: hypothetical protein DDZ88_05145 [Verrucomicrobiales bacterium]|nr:hypothetical protein [Verrucomicrobiales bacterium]